MQHVTLIDDPFSSQDWPRLEVDDVRELLLERYGTWPPGAQIYAGPVAQQNLVTPRTEEDVERLPGYEELTVVIYPADPITAAILVAVVVASAVSIFMMPKVPDLSNKQATSPNNSLSERGNRGRPNARIPDIFGQVVSVPDLIAAPYRVFMNHRELEIAYMCVGRGSYAVEQIRDGDTLVENIAGSTVEVWGPGTSPNNPADDPQILIGTAITDPLFTIARLNEVNGQVLKAPNDQAVRADQEIIFADGGIVQAAGGAIDFTDYFEVDAVIEIGKAVDEGTVLNPVVTFIAARGTAPDKLTFPGDGIGVPPTNLLLSAAALNVAPWAVISTGTVVAAATAGFWTVSDTDAAQHAGIRQAKTGMAGKRVTAVVRVRKDAIGRATRFASLWLQAAGITYQLKIDTATGEFATGANAGLARGVSDGGDNWICWITADTAAVSTVNWDFKPSAGSGAAFTFNVASQGSADVMKPHLYEGESPAYFNPVQLLYTAGQKVTISGATWTQIVDVASGGGGVGDDGGTGGGNLRDYQRYEQPDLA